LSAALLHWPQKSATATIPIVFANGGDPVVNGLITSPNRPGGNVTGVSFLMVALTAKRLELLHETVPAAVEVGYLVNLTLPDVEAELKEAKIAADALGV
jgi:putative tryptophan/tyrosine transport system substrate-binding protein